MKKIWNNYKTILKYWEQFPKLEEQVEEIKENLIAGHNVKTAINELKTKIEILINIDERTNKMKWS